MPVTSRAAIELWWLPPWCICCSVHIAAIKCTQKHLVQQVIEDTSRYDLMWSDLHQDICGHVGPPPASDTSALMGADPSVFKPLDSSFGLVSLHINGPEFIHQHCSHCQMCTVHGKLHEHCYGYQMWHYLVYGWASSLREIPLKQRFENYISICEHLVNAQKDFDKHDAAGVFSAPTSVPPP